MYNMYALARNSWKYVDRDNRVKKIQHIEYSYLAPDTVNEMFSGLKLLEKFAGRAVAIKENMAAQNGNLYEIGKKTLLNDEQLVEELEILAEGFENTKRKTVITKPYQAYHLYRELISFYAITSILDWAEQVSVQSFEAFKQQLPLVNDRGDWLNVGGQLLPKEMALQLISNVENEVVNSWDAVHQFYKMQGEAYQLQKVKHALASLQELAGKSIESITNEEWIGYLQQTITTKEWMVQNISSSRAKDYTNPYRQMVYDTQEEMDKVIGKLADNSFIKQEEEALEIFKKKMTAAIILFSDVAATV